MASLLTQFARVLGIARPAPAPPFGAAWFEPAGPLHDRPRPDGDRRPRRYTEEQRAAVWAKGQPIVGWDPNDWRVDHRGNPMFRQHYGDAGSSFGWEIGHLAPAGGDSLANLRPQLCQVAPSVTARLGATLDLDPYAR